MSYPAALDRCATCNGEAMTFKDAASRAEYRSSHMCQTCQDAFLRERSQTFELHGLRHTIRIDADIRLDESATVEAYAAPLGSEDPSLVVDIGRWTARREIRDRVSTIIRVAIARWCLERNDTLTDGLDAPSLIFSDLDRFLRLTPKIT